MSEYRVAMSVSGTHSKIQKTSSPNHFLFCFTHIFFVNERKSHTDARTGFKMRIHTSEITPHATASTILSVSAHIVAGLLISQRVLSSFTAVYISIWTALESEELLQNLTTFPTISGLTHTISLHFKEPHASTAWVEYIQAVPSLNVTQRGLTK